MNADARAVLRPVPCGARPAASRRELIAGIVADIAAGRPVLTIGGARGIGKSVVARALAVEFTAAGMMVVVVAASGQPDDPLRLQRMIGEAFGIGGGDALAPQELLAAVAGGTGDAGEGIVLLFDDAERLSFKMLRYIWLLVGLFSFSATRLRLVLIGDREPWPALDHPELKSLVQAAGTRLMIWPLREMEAEHYLDSRLRSIGELPRRVITRTARTQVLEQTIGIPGQIDLLTDRVVTQFRQNGGRRVTAATLRAAPGQHPAHMPPPHRKAMSRGVVAVILAVLALGGAGGVLIWGDTPTFPTRPSVPKRLMMPPAPLPGPPMPTAQDMPLPELPAPSVRDAPSPPAPAASDDSAVADSSIPAAAPMPEAAPAAEPLPTSPTRVIVSFVEGDPGAALLAANIAATLKDRGVPVAGPAPASRRTIQARIDYFFARDLPTAQAVQGVVASVAARVAVLRLVRREPPPAPGTVELLVSSR